MRRALPIIPILIAACAIGAGLAGVPVAGADTACTLIASPSGSDSAAGTTTAPMRTAQALADALAPGQVGCLRAGTYAEDVTLHGHGVTLTSYPGGRATITGRFYVPEGSDGNTVSDINLDGINASRLPSPTVNATGTVFRSDDVTNEHTEICFALGNPSWGRAVDTVIEDSRIHDCGKFPSVNQDHGIYVADADGTKILDNVIYNNVDRGIQLYPDAQGTVIHGNIIDGNGEGIIFSGDDGKAASHTTVTGNIVSNAVIRNDIESWYPAGNPTGTDNVVQDNCVWGGAAGTIDGGAGGFSAAANPIADPGYANRAAANFTVSASSPCAALIASSDAPVNAQWSVPTPGVDIGTPISVHSPAPAPVVTTTAPAPTQTASTPSVAPVTVKTTILKKSPVKKATAKTSAPTLRRTTLRRTTRKPVRQTHAAITCSKRVRGRGGVRIVRACRAPLRPAR